jgi:hypothetical protein
LAWPYSILICPTWEITLVLEALHARKAPTVVYCGSELPDKVRQLHPELVALRKTVFPGRIVAEIVRVRRRGAQLTCASYLLASALDDAAYVS